MNIKHELNKIINTGFSTVSIDSLKSIIDAELQKDEEMMDTELIDLCAEIIRANKSGEIISIPAKNKTPRKSHKKLFTALIAAILLVTGTVTVTAAIFDINPIERIVEFYDDYIRIRFDKSGDDATEYKLLGSALATELAENDISPVLLPEAIISEESKITSVTYEVTELMKASNIDFTIGRKKCALRIYKYSDENCVGAVDYPNGSNKVEQIQISNITVYVFEQGKRSTIAYADGLIQYSIDLPFDFDKAIEFAKTIK